MVILGSGGARIVVAKQLRASGGIWFSLAGTRFLLDPGPGSLVRMTGSRHRLDPTKLAGILLSHRHLDHSGDVNNMIEAMTMGGTELRGTLFAPSDALEGDDPAHRASPQALPEGRRALPAQTAAGTAALVLRQPQTLKRIIILPWTRLRTRLSPKTSRRVHPE